MDDSVIVGISVAMNVSRHTDFEGSNNEKPRFKAQIAWQRDLFEDGSWASG